MPSDLRPAVHPVLPLWIDLIGTVNLLRSPKGYLQQMGTAVEAIGASVQLREEWSAIEHRPLHLFVWFHRSADGPRSIPNPGDVNIRACKDHIKVQLASSATRRKGPLPETAAAVAADVQLVLAGVQKRFGIIVPAGLVPVSPAGEEGFSTS